ncbi:unnamed protein product [Merluccius merluccius]
MAPPHGDPDGSSSSRRAPRRGTHRGPAAPKVQQQRSRRDSGTEMCMLRWSRLVRSPRSTLVYHRIPIPLLVTQFLSQVVHHLLGHLFSPTPALTLTGEHSRPAGPASSPRSPIRLQEDLQDVAVDHEAAEQKAKTQDYVKQQKDRRRDGETMLDSVIRKLRVEELNSDVENEKLDVLRNTILLKRVKRNHSNFH